MNISQINQCVVWGSSKDCIRKKIQYETAEILDLNSIDYKQVLIETLSEKQLDKDQLKETHRIEVYSTEYVINDFVAIEASTGEDQGMPIFGKILNILFTENKALLVCKEWPSKYLEDRLNSYCIEEGTDTRLIDADDLADPKPYAIWKSYTSDKDYICLRYVLV